MAGDDSRETDTGQVTQGLTWEGRNLDSPLMQREAFRRFERWMTDGMQFSLLTHRVDSLVRTDCKRGVQAG